MRIKCLQCGHDFEFDGASKDDLGWHTTCPKCDGSFDIDIEEYLVPNGTMVEYHKTIGIIDGNDAKTADEFKDIIYFVCPIEHTESENRSNYYLTLLRDDFEIYE